MGEATPAREARNCTIFNAFIGLQRAKDKVGKLLSELEGDAVDKSPDSTDPPTPPMKQLLQDLPEMITNSTDRINELVQEIRDIVL